MIDSCAADSQQMLGIKQALARINSIIDPICDIEAVPLKAAMGRVLAKAVYSSVNIPNDNNAAMDGYAFSGHDVLNQGIFSLRCVGASWAGQPFQGVLKPGECIRIFTGAVVPEQADSVVMQEHVRVEGDMITLPVDIKIGGNVRKAGEDIRRGDLVCAYPKKLTAVDLALLAAAGILAVPVVRQLKIVFFSTGDELTPLGQPLMPGKIYDSNRYLLSGLLRDESYTVSDGGVIADDKDQLEATLMAAAENNDVIITTGGASIGDADFVREVLHKCGQVGFWKIAMKPGKPLAFGKIKASYFFGLPGNPGAVMATFQQIVLPALRQLTGFAVETLHLTAICTTPLKKAAGRQDFQCGILSQDADGAFFVASAGQQGSHILSSLHRANCYIRLPSDNQGVQAGESVVVEPFSVHI